MKDAPPDRITFIPLREADLPLLHTWLNGQHLRDFYQKTPVTPEQVQEKYLPRIKGEVPTFSHLFLKSGRR